MCVDALRLDSSKGTLRVNRSSRYTMRRVPTRASVTFDASPDSSGTSKAK